MKRKLWTLLACLPVLTACATGVDDEAYMKAYEKHVAARTAAMSSGEKKVGYRFSGISQQIVFWFDSSSPKKGVTIYDGTSRILLAPDSLGPGISRFIGYGRRLPPVPETLRITWREGDYERKKPHTLPVDDSLVDWVGGTIVGDYTVAVGKLTQRIPDEVLEKVKKSGFLRLKIRLLDHGVLFGWDIRDTPYKRIPGCVVRTPENNYCFEVEYSMPGGDFQEAEIADGKLVKKGWYIDKNGQKIETDY